MPRRYYSRLTHKCWKYTLTDGGHWTARDSQVNLTIFEVACSIESGGDLGPYVLLCRNRVGGNTATTQTKNLSRPPQKAHSVAYDLSAYLDSRGSYNLPLAVTTIETGHYIVLGSTTRHSKPSLGMLDDNNTIATRTISCTGIIMVK